ncbi:MAG TPA: hypothetical protein VMB04_02245 [Mycobacterium sp.]|nr:hypothetical protein [Mycobacterium sp.]
MSSNNRNGRWFGVAVGGAFTAAALALAPAAKADTDFQVSIDGYDLFPTAGNLATATTDPGSIEFAAAVGDGASADASGGQFTTAFVDGNDSTASAGHLGTFDTALVIGNDSSAYAGYGTPGDPFDVTNPLAPLFGNPAFFDTAAAFGNGVHASATSGSGVTDIEPAAAVPAAATTGPFEELFGDGGINTWTPSADALLLADDPSLAATLSTSVESFYAAGSTDDPLSLLAFEFDSTGFGGIEPYDIGLPQDFPDAGFPQDLLATLAVGTDYALYASGLSSLGTDLAYLVQIPYDALIFAVTWPEIFLVL